MKKSLFSLSFLFFLLGMFPKEGIAFPVKGEEFPQKAQQSPILSSSRNDSLLATKEQNSLESCSLGGLPNQGSLSQNGLRRTLSLGGVLPARADSFASTKAFPFPSFEDRGELPLENDALSSEGLQVKNIEIAIAELEDALTNYQRVLKEAQEYPLDRYLRHTKVAFDLWKQKGDALLPQFMELKRRFGNISLCNVLVEERIRSLREQKNQLESDRIQKREPIERLLNNVSLSISSKRCLDAPSQGNTSQEILDKKRSSSFSSEDTEVTDFSLSSFSQTPRRKNSFLGQVGAAFPRTFSWKSQHDEPLVLSGKNSSSSENFLKNARSFSGFFEKSDVETEIEKEDFESFPGESSPSAEDVVRLSKALAELYSVEPVVGSYDHLGWQNEIATLEVQLKSYEDLRDALSRRKTTPYYSEEIVKRCFVEKLKNSHQDLEALQKQVVENEIFREQIQMNLELDLDYFQKLFARRLALLDQLPQSYEAAELEQRKAFIKAHRSGARQKVRSMLEEIHVQKEPSGEKLITPDQEERFSLLQSRVDRLFFQIVCQEWLQEITQREMIRLHQELQEEGSRYEKSYWNVIKHYSSAWWGAKTGTKTAAGFTEEASQKAQTKETQENAQEELLKNRVKEAEESLSNKLTNLYLRRGDLIEKRSLWHKNDPEQSLLDVAESILTQLQFIQEREKAVISQRPLLELAQTTLEELLVIQEKARELSASYLDAISQESPEKESSPIEAPSLSRKSSFSGKWRFPSFRKGKDSVSLTPYQEALVEYQEKWERFNQIRDAIDEAAFVEIETREEVLRKLLCSQSFSQEKILTEQNSVR